MASVDVYDAYTAPDQSDIDLSVVMPCLNEEQSVGLCVTKALEGIARSGLRGEVVVSDNGSTDRSVEVAAAAGARIVHQPEKGYGNAYLKGFASARGRYLVMGDSDDTYDFTKLDELVRPLQSGNYDYVLGSRFGGEIRKGAMTWSHRYVGNPILTGVLNLFFGLKSTDAHSGMRAFTREAIDRMGLGCEGMEFASEIVVKAAKAGLRVTEVPIVYHPRIGESKLNGVRDAWRHLRFMLILAPTYLFIYPGLTLFLAGLIGQTVLLSGPVRVGGRELDVHFSILFALITIVGSQALIFGTFTRTYSKSIGLDQQSRLSDWVEKDFSLERGLIAGAMFFLAGFGVDLGILIEWINRSMGPLNAIRPALFALTFMTLGMQVLFASFFLSIFRIKVHTITPRPATDSAGSTSGANETSG
ncbi:MAG: glycosyltransferase family 2 protein [Acidimicrobiaceae bacterium]|nr:glycosyltransferase family 2 protein [Acidimicrobiaceae bacterium]